MNGVICITGASAGIGHTTAKRFATHGWRVVGVARRLDRLEALQNELGDVFYPAAFDVCDRDAVAAAFTTLPPEFADIDVLVNSAGLGKGLDLAQEAKLDDWDVMIQTNISFLLDQFGQILKCWLLRHFDNSLQQRNNISPNPIIYIFSAEGQDYSVKENLAKTVRLNCPG